MRKMRALSLPPMVELVASASPGVGDRTGPGWTTHEVLCAACGEWLGNGNIRDGYARLKVSCARCNGRSELRFPPGQAPLTFRGVAGTDGMKTMFCVNGHLMATVEQAPESVRSYWRLWCPSCRTFRLWPPQRERRLTHTR